VDAAFDRLEAACQKDITEREFYAALSVTLARIRCSHTKAEPSKAWADWRSSTPSYLPFRFIEDDGRMIVTRSAAEGLRPGDDTREPERGALARLAEVLDVSDQRVRVVYAGDVAVREDTLARWEATVAAHVAACGFCADKRAEGEEVPNGDEA
jgi:hypothetical protein